VYLLTGIEMRRKKSRPGMAYRIWRVIGGYINVSAKILSKASSGMAASYEIFLRENATAGHKLCLKYQGVVGQHKYVGGMASISVGQHQYGGWVSQLEDCGINSAHEISLANIRRTKNLCAVIDLEASIKKGSPEKAQYKALLRWGRRNLE